MMIMLEMKLGLQDYMIFKAQSASYVNNSTQYETRLFDIKHSLMSKLELRLPQYLLEIIYRVVEVVRQDLLDLLVQM